MLETLKAKSIMEFHDSMLNGPQRTEWQTQSLDSRDERVAAAWYWIGENHKCNTLLWDEEDKARCNDVADTEIVACKRNIDRYNQKRNDAVEAIDEALLSILDCGRHADNARLNSETAGAMIDRLSILSLKIFHMREQTLRMDVDAQHIAACEAKLQRLIMQRQDLGFCLDSLINDAYAGRAYFKIYRQFKMYNDPALNPYLCRWRGPAAVGGAAI